MARRVKISALGASPPRAPAGLQGEALVEYLIEFWRHRIDDVLPDRPDLIVLPEACDSFEGESLDWLREFYELRGARVLAALREVARDNACYLVFPTIRALTDGTWRNSALMLDRRGETVGCYDKNHIVTGETEHFGILSGGAAPIIECDFGRVACVICFDLNFDELRLQYAAAKPDLILFPSMYHGGLMQSYWAYSCRAHFVGCVSEANLPSTILSPVGNVLATSTNYCDFVTAEINLDCQVAHYDGHFAKLATMKRSYGTQVTVFDPGQLGSVLITSHSETASAVDMLREFEIESLDDYLSRSRNYQRQNRELAPPNINQKGIASTRESGIFTAP